MEMFVGVGASRVRDLFQQARKMGRAIIFIDEIDSIGRKRGAGLGGGHDEREQTLNQMLSEMDGFETAEGIVILAATNRPDILDPALLRPGRFDRQIVVPLPEYEERLAILKVHSRDKRMGPDVDLDVMAKATPGMCGADLANLVNEAALVAVRRGSKQIERIDFENARDRVVLGARRESLVLSAEEKRATAYHEGGHALLATVLPHGDPLHKVTILPRGMALGVTWSLPQERHTYSKEFFEDTICKAMGGRVAEKIVFDHLNTGAANDLEQATEHRPPDGARVGHERPRRPDGVEQPAAGVPRRGPDDAAAASTATTPPSCSTRRSPASSPSRSSGRPSCSPSTAAASSWSPRPARAGDHRRPRRRQPDPAGPHRVRRRPAPSTATSSTPSPTVRRRVTPGPPDGRVTRRRPVHGRRRTAGPQVGGRHRPEEACPHDAVGVGDHERGTASIAVARRAGRGVPGTRPRRHGDVVARQHLGLADDVGARVARRRREHGDQPRRVRPGEVGAVELRGHSPGRLRRRVGPRRRRTTATTARRPTATTDDGRGDRRAATTSTLRQPAGRPS